MEVDEPVRKTYHQISLSNSIYIRFCYQDLKLRGTKLHDHLVSKGFPSIPQRTLLYHGKKPAFEEVGDRRKFNCGRPRKLTDRDTRNILLNLTKLRERDGDFSSVQIQEESGISTLEVSNRTIRRRLNENHYFYLQSRKKGLLTDADLKKRLAFGRKYANKPLRFWTHDILFYLDGVGWGHKVNPSDHAKTLRTRTWRKHCEGTKNGCTAKGKKEGVGGKMVYFIVAIAHGKGLVKAMPYDGHINAKKFAAIIRDNFPEIMKCFADNESKLFLQDGDRSQNSKEAVKAMDEVGCERFPIPARTPDGNPIENVFHLMSKKIKRDGLLLEIQSETYEQFRDRCYQTIINFSPDIIDKTIESMPARMKAIIKEKGHRTKY